MPVTFPHALNCSIVLADLPLLDRPRAAADAGFDAVEFWWPFATAAPSDAEVDRFARAIEDAGVRLIGLNIAAGDMPAGDRGLASWPGRAQEFRDSVAVAVGLGERLGTRIFNALYGNRIDGTVGQDEIAAENLAHAAKEAGRIGATIVLEPLSGTDRYPLRTAAQAVEVLDRVGAPNLGLLADLYHLAANGEDLDAVIARYADRIAHVQLADVPGRHEPGTGELDFAHLLDALRAAGYSGRTALEYVPTRPDFAWLGTENR
ncbi:TIM barrel protein [Pseudonocardia kujensis]|uniref:hydroxypyruvate isomerase family protein n=1 Tax=Pseudonocardia kujensis TaxID=1128675 RepID=UPI001E331153|nr:TIM barrel protein [Pseudonocardia kujensis]MCE0765459.1 TIM barrel protein [Pseudonocardia kujensis]